MPSTVLTDALCAKPVKERVKIFDATLSGLYVSKTPTKCTFVYKFWDRAAKKQRPITIGIFDPVALTVKIARDRAKVLNGQRLQGIDIIKRAEVATIAAGKGALTFNEVADKWIAWLQVPEEKPHGVVPRCESWRQYDLSLSRPRAAFSKKRVADVSADDIASLIHGIEDERNPRTGASKRGIANNVRRTLSVFFNWACQAGHDRRFVPFNPCTSAHLGKRPKKASKDRNLSPDEIRTLWNGLNRAYIPCDRNIALALKLILCTGLRPGEVSLARREELHDLTGENPQYHVRAEIVKLRRPIYQPLNSLAQEIVRELLADGVKTGSLFRTSRYSRSGEGGGLLSKALRSEKNARWKERRIGICEFLGLKPFTPHDLRRTAATLLGAAGVHQGAIAQVLDHQKKPGEGATASTLIYDRSQKNERRATLDALDGILREIVGPAPKVVQLRVA